MTSWAIVVELDVDVAGVLVVTGTPVVRVVSKPVVVVSTGAVVDASSAEETHALKATAIVAR